MTKKEAINLLGWLKSKTNREDDLKAIDMAIEALSAEPTGELILRTDAIDAVECAKPIDEMYHYYKHIAVDALSALPSTDAVFCPNCGARMMLCKGGDNK